MSGPLIPYITLPEIPLAFLQHLPWLGEMVDPKHPPSIKPFGTLVALGVYFGTTQVMRRARERGWNQNHMSDYLVWAVGTGFVLSHVLDAIFYHPETVLRDPLYLLKIWDGLSSYGGFIGAVVGSIAYRFYHRRKVLRFIDVTVSGMPLAWVFGRSGCAVVHDHPGIRSDVWFAVQFPTPGGGFIGRLDLGLIEMVLTIPIAIAVAWLWRRKPHRPDGFYIAFVGLVYPPIRFVLDFFRIGAEEAALGADERYASLTPAQWASFWLFLTGAYFAWKIYRSPKLAPAGDAPAEGGQDADEQQGGPADATDKVGGPPPAEAGEDAREAAGRGEPADPEGREDGDDVGSGDVPASGGGGELAEPAPGADGREGAASTGAGEGGPHEPGSEDSADEGPEGSSTAEEGHKSA